MTFLTKPQINEMAQAILSTHEVTPLSHSSKCRVALEYALDASLASSQTQLPFCWL
jgi:hypothetical protein